VPHLAATCSPYLINLLGEKEYSLDAVELTPWQSVSSLPSLLPELANYTLYFHGSNLTDRLRFLPGARSQLSEMLRLTQARWFSTHISLLPPGWLWLSQRFNIHLPLPPVKTLLAGFLKNVERLKREQPGIPLLLENMPVEPNGVDKSLKSPAVIREVLERTDCGFLLDLPHARIAAEAFCMETTEYLLQLPLDRVVEIHTSGPGRGKDGALMDQHCRMQPEDYQLLRWAMAHTPAQLVTLEYYKDRAGLEEQISELIHLFKTNQPR
jgi:uncharacterized protein (UPF0276 family)